MAGLQDDSDVAGVGFQPADVADEPGQAGRGVLDTAQVDQAAVWGAERCDMERFGPVQSDAQHRRHLLLEGAGQGHAPA
jgi:hypothetical protein